MKHHEFRQTRVRLGLPQGQLAEQLKTTRQSIIRYENGNRQIPGMAEVALSTLETAHVPVAGIVAAGGPIELIPNASKCPRAWWVEAKPSPYASREFQCERGIMPGDVVVVQKQATARNGQTVIALVNGEATIKTYHRKADTVELHPANETMYSLVIKPSDTLQIEGIVVGVLRHLRK